jgi:hypothetical protein
MRYMLLIYTKEEAFANSSPEEREKVAGGHWAVMEEAMAKGVFRGAEPLDPTSTATTIRVQDGKVLVTDGPFAETKEQLAGYYILDCQDLDEVIRYAEKIPTKCQGGTGCVEIRPMRELPPNSKLRNLNQEVNALNG